MRRSGVLDKLRCGEVVCRFRMNLSDARGTELASLFGLDCVCPFERPPGGDIDGRRGLEQLRTLLDDRVTMNGNVHTVETLIRGTPADVRTQVIEILEAFEGSPRLIVGTGDQVGGQTPDENIYAMIETVREHGGQPS